MASQAPCDNVPPKWTIEALQTHLQAAVDLEFWTIPFYLSAKYSIVDPSSQASQLIQSVVYQEMLHVQLAANIANAFGTHVTFNAPRYIGHNIPHLDFKIDTPDPRLEFHPYSAEIGALDEARINSMCLIEYPEWRTGHTPHMQPTVQEYGSIGEFYTAVGLGISELAAQYLVGNRNQVNAFQRFYAHFSQPTITLDGLAGLPQALNLATAITDQGEGTRKGDATIPPAYQNTADDIAPELTHFQKFIRIRDAQYPSIYLVTAQPTPAGREAQKRLIQNFTDFRRCLEDLFSGGNPQQFAPLMASLGGNIINCWQHGVIPQFSDDNTTC